MLDIGQGDCICVQGPKHQNYLIDGGSSDVKEIGKYRIEPFLKSRGIAQLDYVFLSHGDLDHMNGIEELLIRQDVGVRIRNLVVPGKQYWDERILKIITMAKMYGTDVKEMEYGTELKEGEMKFTCLGPGGNTDDKSHNVTTGNESSMIPSTYVTKYVVYRRCRKRRGKEADGGPGCDTGRKEDYMGNTKDSASWFEEFYNGDILSDTLSAVCMDISREKEPLRTSA